MNLCQQIICMILVCFVIGCDDKEQVSVTAENHVMDADQFDLGVVISKLKSGDLKNAAELAEFINTTDGINNVDIDKDGNIDEITVTEERADNGKFAMVVKAHPKSEEPTVISEIQITKQAGDVHIAGSYPHYVHGYQGAYYNHTLTGSAFGDMMFYSWLFSPRPIYEPIYNPGMYYHTPRSVYNSARLESIRKKSYRGAKIAPLKKKSLPKSFKPRSKIFKKQSMAMKKKGFGTSSKGTNAKPIVKNKNKKSLWNKPKPTPRPISKPKPLFRSSPSPRPFSRPSYRR